VVGDVVYFTNDYHGTIAVRVSRVGESWRAERVYRTGALAGRTASPVYLDGHLYGLHKRGRVACINALTGKRQWVARDFDQYLSLILIGDRALALDNRGKLAVIQLSPEEYRPLGTSTIGEYTWGYPALDSERFYYRDGDDVACLSLKGTVE
jgi:outer membrane protein assembly factor BamB